MTHHIRLFKHQGLWCFNYASMEIFTEPFLQGMDLIIDELVRLYARRSQNPILVFTDGCPPSTFTELYWQKSETRPDGTWSQYHCERLNLSGWLCPVLRKFYPQPPEAIHVRMFDIASGRFDGFSMPDMYGESSEPPPANGGTQDISQSE